MLQCSLTIKTITLGHKCFQDTEYFFYGLIYFFHYIPLYGQTTYSSVSLISTDIKSLNTDPIIFRIITIIEFVHQIF
jgi:hypothetical protein